jgi:hypothetical protein
LDIREDDDGTVTLDGLTIGGFVAPEKSCPFCSEVPTIYFDAFDSYACPRCDRWTEAPCSDRKCKFCPERPSVPFSGQSAPRPLPVMPRTPKLRIWLKRYAKSALRKNHGGASRHRHRLTLRTVMAVIVVWALLLVWIRSQGSFFYALVVVSHSVTAWGLCLIAAFGVARVFGPAVTRPVVRAALSALFTVALLVSLYLTWAYHRAMYDFIHGLEYRFPYPDPAINALERWFDARRPVPPGCLKLHGEYPLVGFVLGMLIVVGVSSSGFLFGTLSNRPEVSPRDCGEASRAGTVETR